MEISFSAAASISSPCNEYEHKKREHDKTRQTPFNMDKRKFKPTPRTL